MGYEHEIGSLVNGIFNQSADIGFVMKPISLDTFEKLHQATLILPPKSTFFHPKLPAGLTMRELLWQNVSQNPKATLYLQVAFFVTDCNIVTHPSLDA